MADLYSSKELLDYFRRNRRRTLVRLCNSSSKITSEKVLDIGQDNIEHGKLLFNFGHFISQTISLFDSRFELLTIPNSSWLPARNCGVITT